MKKIIDFFVNILLAIVYPNRILNLFRVKNLDQNSNKILGNDNVVKILAFLAAMTFVIVARYTPPVPTTYSHTLPPVQLETVLDDRFTHFGSPIPNQINVILSGDQTQITMFLAGNNTVRAYLDLDGLDLGVEHNHVPIRIEGIPEQVTATPTPNVVSGIYIAEIEEREFRIELTTNNSEVFDELDEPTSRYGYRKTLAEEYVIIRGPAVLLDDIAEVRAIFNAVDVANIVGARYYPALLVANNIFGVIISDVDIYPEIVSVEVEIYEDLRTIPINFDENLLNFPRTHELIEVTADINEVLIWGDFADMEETIELPRIDFRALDDEGQITFPVELPPDVYTEVDGVVVTVVEVVVTVTYEEPSQREPRRNEVEDDVSRWLYEKEEKYRRNRFL